MQKQKVDATCISVMFSDLIVLKKKTKYFENCIKIS